MKKLVLALACLASFAFLASCKLETTSKDSGYTYKLGTVSGKITDTIVLTTISGTKDADGKFIPTEGAKELSVTEKEEDESATQYSLSFNEYVNSNYTDYSFALYDKDNTYLQNVVIRKIGEKYFWGVEDITRFISASIDGDFTFTYSKTTKDEYFINEYGSRIYENSIFNTVAGKVATENTIAYNLSFKVTVE